MPVRIPLPEIQAARSAGAHPFPFQIAKQTEDFLYASVWYLAFLDAAAGRYVRLPWGLWAVRRGFKVTDTAWKRSMGAFFQYEAVFNKAPLQLTLISMKSHWDWFVTSLAGFVTFARGHVSSPPLAPKRSRMLASLARNRAIEDQVALLREATGLALPFSNDNRAALKEMTLVRNLGIHNRWEVDNDYIEKSDERSSWTLGELRVVTGPELERWERGLIQLIRDCAFPIAFQYSSVPDFPGTHGFRAA